MATVQLALDLGDLEHRHIQLHGALNEADRVPNRQNEVAWLDRRRIAAGRGLAKFRTTSFLRSSWQHNGVVG
jgi:hypothetical protein